MVMHRRYYYIIGLFLALSVQLSGQIIPGVVASSIRSSNFPTSGLIGYWKMDESSGDLIDAHSTYDGTPTSLTYSVSGAINTAVTFNGTSSRVAFGTGIKPTTGLSVSFWMKTTSTASSFIIDLTGYVSNWCGFRIERHSNGITAFLADNTANYLDEAVNVTVGDGSWHHVVMTWNGSNVYVYTDNSKSTAFPWSSTIVYETGDILYAGSSSSGSYYTGSLDELAIYNRALTDEEVTILFDKEIYPN